MENMSLELCKIWSLWAGGLYVQVSYIEQVWLYFLCFLTGNEGVGLDDAMLQSCDGLLTIRPGDIQHDSLDSLNVSVATGR